MKKLIIAVALLTMAGFSFDAAAFAVAVCDGAR
jgi:hypothetical protein